MDKLKDLLEAGKISQEVYDLLSGEFGKVISQRDAARTEAADRRVKLKELKEKADTAGKLVQGLADKFGVDLEDENAITALKDKLEEIGNIKDEDINKLKEFEAKFKRVERERNELEEKLQREQAAKVSILKQKELGTKLSKYDVIDRETTEAYLDSRIVVEEDGIKFKTKDGVLVGLDDGLEEFFKEEKPNLLKGFGKEGSGVQGGGITAALRNSNNADDILKAAGVKK